uniref:Proline/serine-rich coiled-coil protein 1 n=1 Tax=Aquila chrysaetos chrysaetos TaxID=223781 RepID=A0A663EMJ9_AQUCH
MSPLGTGGPGLTPRVPPDVRFVTEESFDFGFLSPSDSQEEEEDEESPAGAGARGGSGRWSPLSGARLEEMVREATRLAAQLEQCHLPPPIPSGPPSAHRSPRSPRRETFVVKDSPVRALLPTVEPRGPPTATARPPAKPRGAPAAANVPGPPLSPSPLAVPSCPAPSPGRQAGPRWVHLHPEVRMGAAGGWAGGCPPPPRASVSPCPMAALPIAGAGAARAAPRPAGSGCKPGPPPQPPPPPPGRRRGELGKLRHGGAGLGPPPREEAEAQAGFCFNYKRSHQQ